tara:strand:- start:131 stop:367 length:237 start_codon:yes stop_codon:yes gene_type:complete
MKEPSEFDFGNNKGENIDPNPSPLGFTAPTCPRCGGAEHLDTVGTHEDGNICKVKVEWKGHELWVEKIEDNYDHLIGE